MKKIMTLALALAFVTPMEANASCGAGQGSGVEINVTTKQVSNYCVDITPPTQTELENQARQVVQQTLEQQANAIPIRQTVSAPITIDFLPAEPEQRPRVLEVNATTGVIIERDYTDAEMAQWRIDRATSLAREKAFETAQVSGGAGVETCVDWEAFELKGSECYYQSVTVLQQEIDDQMSFLQNLFADNWLRFLDTFIGIWN